MVAALVLLLLLCSCSVQKQAQDVPDEVPAITNVLEKAFVEDPKPPASPIRDPNRLIRGDLLRIEVAGEEELDSEAVIAPDGRLYALFFDALPASGSSLEELRQELTVKLRHYLRTPEVALTLEQLSSETLSQSESVPFKLRIGDRLILAIYGEPETKRAVQVSSTGKIDYLYLKSITALDKTIPELRQAVEEELKSDYQHPLLLINYTSS